MKQVSFFILFSCTCVMLRAQVQKGQDIVLEKVMQSNLQQPTLRIGSDGNKVAFADGAKFKVYDYIAHEWTLSSKHTIIETGQTLNYLQMSDNGKVMAAVLKDTISIFDLGVNNNWVERTRITGYKYQSIGPFIQLSPDGMTLAIISKKPEDFYSSLILLNWSGSNWSTLLNKAINSIGGFTYMNFDNTGEKLFFSDAYRNFVVVIKSKNGVYTEQRQDFVSDNPGLYSQKLFSKDAKHFIEVRDLSCTDKMLSIREYIISENNITESNHQILNLCTNRYQILSGDGNTLVFSNGDVFDFTGDTIWVYKRGLDGKFVPFGNPITFPAFNYSIGLNMSIDFTGQTLSMLIKPNNLASGLKSYIRTYDLTLANNVTQYESSAQDVSVYPNPASDFIYAAEGNNLLSLFDSTGKKVLSCQPETSIIDVRDISSGMYFLLTEKNKKPKVTKVIKL